jgi:hypothetical protein
MAEENDLAVRFDGMGEAYAGVEGRREVRDNKDGTAREDGPEEEEVVVEKEEEAEAGNGRAPLVITDLVRPPAREILTNDAIGGCLLARKG